MIGEEQAEGGEGRSELRNEDAPDTELRRLHAGVERPVAAERDEHEGPRVDAAPRRHLADRVRHVGVHQTEDARRGTEDRDAERRRHPVAERRMGPLHVETHLSVPEALGAQVAEHEVGVRHRGLGPAVLIADWAGMSTSTPGTDFQQPARVDPGDTATTRAD